MATGRIPTTANSPLTAKGDLFTFSTGSAKLAVGNNGDTLVADSGTATGLRYAEDYAAGKNKIINGDFGINQRAFTSNTTNNAYNFDRWAQANAGTTGTLTVTPQTFTPGTAPVSGYESKNFIQCVTAAGASADTYAALSQAIEDVRTLAGQTATISFWAKAASGTPKIALEIVQNFGSGGSPSSTVVTNGGSVTLSTSWARYSLTVAVPSISGKTIGTTNNTSYLQPFFWLSAGSDFASRASSIGLQNNTFQIWGVQVEESSVATAFQTATGTIQGELAACQRYYYRNFPAVTDIPLGQGSANGTRYILGVIALPVSMRVAPTSAEFSALKATDGATGASTVAALASYGNSPTTATYYFDCTSGLTQYRNYKIETSSSAGYLGFSAEL